MLVLCGETRWNKVVKRLDCYMYAFEKAVSAAFQQVWSQLSLAVSAHVHNGLSVISLVVASSVVLKVSLMLCSVNCGSSVRHWLNKLNTSSMPTIVLVTKVDGSITLMKVNIVDAILKVLLTCRLLVPASFLI